MAGREDGEVPFGSLIKVDHRTGASTRHDFGAGHVAGEPIFVPRAPDSGEDDGWLLTVVYSAAEHRSRLVVLDARDVEADALAVAHLRHHVPLGFHGTFTQRIAA
jgi:all-trans-8'-apo-beta-carotenal 15,15'-oxygenase